MRTLNIKMNMREATKVVAILKAAEKQLRAELDELTKGDWYERGKMKDITKKLDELHRCRWLIGGLERGLKSQKREG